MKAMKVFLLSLLFTCVAYVAAPVYDDMSPPQDVTVIIDQNQEIQIVSTIDVDVISEDPFRDFQQVAEFLSGEQIILVVVVPQSFIETNENFLNIRGGRIDIAKVHVPEGVIVNEHKGKPFKKKLEAELNLKKRS